ncbi:MAG: ABC-three component system middle component 2 [Pleomorphochaeta sp.]
MSESLYNTKFEIGLRALFILKGLNFKPCSLERLSYLDYLSLYIEDIKPKEKNLHPRYPFQLIEAYGKKKILKESMINFSYKGLIDVINYDGLFFQSNVNTIWFLAPFDNEYSKQLSKNIDIIINEIGNKTDKEIKSLIFTNNVDDSNEFYDFYLLGDDV